MSLRAVQTIYGFGNSSSFEWKFFFRFGLRILCGEVTSGGVFAFFWPTLPSPRRQSNDPNFGSRFRLETRLLALEPFIGFLPYGNRPLIREIPEKSPKYL